MLRILLGTAVTIEGLAVLANLEQLQEFLYEGHIYTEFPNGDLSVKSAIPTMNCLTEINLIKSKYGVGHCDLDWASFHSDHLLQVLQAVPNLQVLRFWNVDFSEKEAENVGAALQQHSILQQMHTLGFYYEWPISKDDPDMQDCIRWSRSVLHNMILHCPKLATFINEDWADRSGHFLGQ